VAQLKQEVTLKVWSAAEGGDLILDATGLRIDFDIRLIPDFSRAKFIIYNLTEKAVQSMMSGDRYVTLTTQLHNGTIYTLANRFHLSNAVDELKLPNRLTTLYCFDTMKLKLELPVEVTVLYPNLERMIQQSCVNAGVTPPRAEDFISFPKGITKEPGLKEQRPLQGSLMSVFKTLEKEFNFLTFTDNGKFNFMYMPDIKNVGKTDLGERSPDVILSTRSMRSNPKIGIASCKINSNLDGRIKPTTLMDLSQLLTVSPEASEQTLELVDGYLKNFSDYSKYQAFTVQHKGSNYTAEWSTIVTGLSPTEGKLSPTVNWAQ
tara:strand:+ start:1099 stop:2055 length:957 start_codon:yes stop_codon:yes gene_type:complete